MAKYSLLMTQRRHVRVYVSAVNCLVVLPPFIILAVVILGE